MVVTHLDGHYLHVGDGGAVTRSVMVNPGLLVDIDADGRVLGVESVGEPAGQEQLAAVLAHIKVSDMTPDYEAQS